LRISTEAQVPEAQSVADAVSAELAGALERAVSARALSAPGGAPDIVVEKPKDLAHGDVASNLAMRLAKSLTLAPRQIAEILCAHLGDSDIIAIHAPKTAETHHLITADLLARIRPGAILIQNARSWVVDQEALLRELQTGRFVAAIDVFDQEPQPPDSPFFALDNVIVTPHAAGHSRDSHERQGLAMVEEIERFSRSEPLRYAIAAGRYELLA